MSIESRVERLEKSVGGATVPKSPEETSTAFVRGEYGNTADFFRQILSAPDREASLESLRGRLPDVVVDQLKGVESRRETSLNLSAG